MWRRAEAAGIELTAGRDAKGYRWLSAERRAKVEEARRANPKATQEEVARAAGVSRATVSRIERGDRRGASLLHTPPDEVLSKRVLRLVTGP